MSFFEDLKKFYNFSKRLFWFLTLVLNGRFYCETNATSIKTNLTHVKKNTKKFEDLKYAPKRTY